MLARTCRAALVAACCSWTVASAQNLLGNPDFDTNLSGWTNVSADWGAVASGWPLGATTPGSARVINDAFTEEVGSFIRQCVPVTPSTRYMLSFYGRIPTGQGETGSAGAVLIFYDGPSCTLGYHEIGTVPMVATASSAWQRAGWTGSSPATAQSAQVDLNFVKHEAGGSLTGYFDGIYLGPPVKGDFNADGRVDLVLDDLGSSAHRVWRMFRSYRALEELVTPDADGADWKLATTDDFDGDGRTDLVFRHAPTGDMQFWLMNGVARTSVAPLSGAVPPPPNWTLTASADFDADGQPDLLWRNETSQKLVVWTLNGTVRTGALAPTPDHAVAANWTCLAALDVDKDGHPDLLWYNETTGKVVVWYLDANLVRLTGAFTSPPNAGDNNWKVVAAGNYALAPAPTPASDGVDIVWRNQTSGRQVLWYLDTTAVRVGGGFTTPDSPTPSLGFTIVGPR